MIFQNPLKNKFWHRHPAERTFSEKVARWFLIPSYNDTGYTFDEWDKYRDRMKKAAPRQWFISKTVPDLWNTLVVKRQRALGNFFRYRIKERYHVVDTGLEPNYHDPDTRMFHAMFSILVDYVEKDLASMQLASLEAEKNPGESSFAYYARRKLFRKDVKPSATDGLAYLDWEIEEAPRGIGANQLNQADRAREKKFLYLWWTQYRPARMLLYTDPLIWSGSGYDESKSVFSQDCGYQYHLVSQIKKLYDAEDEEMLHRLIDIRTSLWT